MVAEAVTNGMPVRCLGLTKRYGRGPWALRDMDLEIDAGVITALVGPNGAGKTTLLRTLLGFERATKGAVSVFGFDPWRQRASTLASIAYVPQSSALYGGLTVDDHLALLRFMRRDFDIAAARQRLAEVGIPLRSVAGQLSGGQQAQLALAMALATDARLLLLDEPLASLDPLARRGFLQELLRATKASGAAVLMTSHIVSDVEEVCSHVAIIGGGRLRLHSAIPAARAAHWVRPAGGDPDAALIGAFTGPDGAPVELLSGPPTAGARPEAAAGREATIEEIVLGYLSQNVPAA